MEEIWITMKEAETYSGKSRQAVAAAVKRHEATDLYIYRVGHGNGGRRKELLLSSLPEDIQTAYHAANPIDLVETPIHRISDVQTPIHRVSAASDEPAELDPELEAKKLLEAPEHNRKKAEKYLAIINASEGLKGNNLKLWIVEWNAENPDNKTTYASLMRNRKNYKQKGISALLGKWGNRKGKSKVTDEWLQIFATLYLKEGGTSLKDCHWLTMGHVAKQHKEQGIPFDESEFPTAAAFERRLKNHYSESVIYQRRHGKSAWEKKFGYHIDRDFSDLAVGEVWVFDHMQSDVMVIGADGKTHRPWVTACTDFKSQKMLAVDVHIDAPNSTHIFNCFYRAAVTHGIPTDFYLDNGKDFLCIDFAGGRKTERKVRLGMDEFSPQLSVIQALGIKAHFAWPYHGQSKNIERIFSKLNFWYSRHQTGYVGKDIVSRPEQLKRDIKAGSLKTFEEFVKEYESFLFDIYNKKQSQAKTLQGKCPDQLWAQEYEHACKVGAIRHVSPASLALICTRISQAKKLTGNGWHDTKLGVHYWSTDVFHEVGTRAYLRRDEKDMSRAYCFEEGTNRFIGVLTADLEKAAAIARTDKQQKVLHEHIARKKSHEKVMHAVETNAEEIDYLEAAHGAIEATTGTFVMPNFSSNVVQATAMDHILTKLNTEKPVQPDLTKITKPKKAAVKLYPLFESDK